MPKLRLLLLDDHTLFRESLARLLDAEPDFEMAADCSTIAQAIAALRAQHVDLILLDYDLGDERAPNFLDQLASLPSRPRVLIVTAGMSSAESAQILRQGASGIFLKHSSPALLSEAIRKVYGGETWIDQHALRGLVDAAARSDAPPDRKNLTGRERQVLRAVFEGLSNKQIAATLAISESSVKAALQQLFQKTGVRTRSQLVRVALEQFQGDLD
jgi:DNA-binding NarL/FixJ family response regulator